MAEELKACAECGAPEGYVSGERFMAEHERVRELRAEIAALRAKASQVGEAVAEYQQLSRYGNWDRIDKVDFDLGILGSCPEKFRALYTHPADQVAEPVLERPAKVGAGTFSAGLPQRMVVEAAYRQYEYAQDPPFSDENIKSLVQAFTQGNPQVVAPDNFREPAQMVDPELVELLRGLVEIVGRKNRGRSGSPNHGHSIPGIWDSDNGDLAGKPCAECALYDLAVARIAALQP